jgi:hypothetical protein
LCTDGGAQGDDAREAVFQARGYSAAVACLQAHAQDRGTALAGLACLRNASGSADTAADRSRSLLVRSGAIAAVLAALDARPTDGGGPGAAPGGGGGGPAGARAEDTAAAAAPVCAQGAAALFNLAAGRDAGARRRRDAIVLAGGHSRLVQALLAFGDSPQVSRLCLGALWALTSADGGSSESEEGSDSSDGGRSPGGLGSGRKSRDSRKSDRGVGEEGEKEEEEGGEEEEEEEEEEGSAAGLSAWLPATVAGCLAPFPRLRHSDSEDGEEDAEGEPAASRGVDAAGGAAPPSGSATTPSGFAAAAAAPHVDATAQGLPPPPPSLSASPSGAPASVAQPPPPPPRPLPVQRPLPRRVRPSPPQPKRLGTAKRCAAVVAAGGHVAACACLQALRFAAARDLERAAARATAAADADARALAGGSFGGSSSASEPDGSSSSGGVDQSWLGAAIGRWLPRGSGDDPAEVAEAKARVAAQAAAARRARRAAAQAAAGVSSAEADAATSDAALAAVEEVGRAFLTNLEEGLAAALLGNDSAARPGAAAGELPGGGAAHGNAIARGVFARARADVYAMRRQCGLAD